ncbi:MAG: Rieske (2Fe-2S) protein [Myxococcota bacterium]
MEPSRRDLLCAMCIAAVACETSTSSPRIPDTTGDTDDDTDPIVDTDVPWSPCVEPGTAAEGWVEVPFSTYPDLARLHGSAYLNLGGFSIVIAQVEEGCYVALERPCTHEGEPIEYREERNGFVCPRHGAIYGWNGAVLAGPPPQDLRAFPCGPRGEAVWVLIG